MTKKIETLVDDIYELFDKGVDVDQSVLDSFGAELARLVGERLRSYKEVEKPYLRMSSLGKNPLQLYYDINGYPEGSTNVPEPLTPGTKLKFLYGDIIEHLMLFLAEAAGHSVTDKQKKVELDGVLGSLDAKIDGCVLDVKSTATRGLDKFNSSDDLRRDDPFGYIRQISGYCQAEGATEGYFLAVGKESGVLKLLRVDAEDVRPTIKRLKEILAKGQPPGVCDNDSPEGKSGNRVLDVPCTYCRHKRECWKYANGGLGLRSFYYSNGIKHLTHVEREPLVPEIKSSS